MSKQYYKSDYYYRPPNSKLPNSYGSGQSSDSDIAELSDLNNEDEDESDEIFNNKLYKTKHIDQTIENYDDDCEINDELDEFDDYDEEEDDDDDEDQKENGEIDDNELPYPGFVPIALKYLDQSTRPRNWCLILITNPWFERISMMIILLNCITLGMYQPCVDDQCVTNRCKILQMFDDIIFTFFALEMMIKMVAMGIYGKGTYLADSWNRLDFFIVMAGALEYCLNVENMNLSAIRTIRVLRPLRAINRIPSMRILVMLLLDTLPMLGNVLLLCFFVFFIFGIVGVQLWEGILRQRCFLKALPNVKYPDNLEKYFEYQGQDYICSRPDDNGMHMCDNLPPLKIGDIVCNSTAVPNSNITIIDNTTCVNWNYYYTECKGQGNNPFQGTISFDNIGLAWVAIFLVISLEGWTDIMYYVQDAHSFWDWIYFVLLIVIGSFFMINLCLVVIATQFSETKKREMERMRMERARFHSTSTLASSTNTSEPTTCYAEIVKYIAHLWRKGKRSFIKKYRIWKYRRQQKQESYLLRNQHGNLCANIVNLRSNNINADKRCHYRKCCHQLSGIVKEVSECHPPSRLRTQAPRASPEISETDVSSHQCCSYRLGIQRLPSTSSNGNNENNVSLTEASNTLLSPPSAYYRRRSSVMFNDVVMLHGDNMNTTSDSIGQTTMGGEHNVCSSEKMTQTGDGNVWSTPSANYFDMSKNETMTCQELLALSGALSAALPTGQLSNDSFLASLTKEINYQNSREYRDEKISSPEELEICSCYCDIYEPLQWSQKEMKEQKESKLRIFFRNFTNFFIYVINCIQKWIKKLVEHKYFQQGILFAILINTLSMGIEYHNQPEELTVIVEISNIIFSAVFAVEMLLKIIAEGPFAYISNGFNVFDGIVVILSVVELCQSFAEEKGAGSSGLSVLRTFRLLRILKLVRFMPNLRRQLFVMLRTMDNVAVFFSLLVLFIFIFSILGMNLFGCKFRESIKGSSEVECDRKNFDSLLWAIVTVFQILTQEDWNVVLFNGMQKTSHWAALYFVALMTFGNYVLFNLLVAILVEGFSSERNERREREQREMAKLATKENGIISDEGSSSRLSGSHSLTDSDTYTQDHNNSSHSVDDIRKYKDYRKDKCNLTRKFAINELKCNIQKENKMICDSISHQPPMITHTAATPQDSPNTTLETGYRDLNYRTICPIDLSIESIDRTNSQCSIASSGYLKLPDNNNYKYATNNLNKSELTVEKLNTALSTVMSTNSSAVKELNSLNSPTKIRRGYSWRLSRPSICKKRWSHSDHDNSPSILNNGRNASGSNFGLNFNETNGAGGSNYNSLYVCGSIRNDTQTNNRGTVMNSYNHSLSPNSSIKSYNPSIENYRMNSQHHQMRWIDDLSRRSSLCSYDIVHARKIIPYDDIPLNTSRTINNLIIDTNPLPSLKRMINEGDISQSRMNDEQIFSPNDVDNSNNSNNINNNVNVNNNININNNYSNSSSNNSSSSSSSSSNNHIKKFLMYIKPGGCLKERDDYALYIFSSNNKFRKSCQWFVERKWFDNVILAFIGLNCITLAMERPTISADSRERIFLSTANYIFTVVFAIEMFIKVISSGMLYGSDAYFTSGWNIMDGVLVIISIVDLLMSLISSSSPRIFGILRVFRLLRSLRPLRVINRAPGLKLVVQTLLSSLRPIGNIVLICCTFFIIFGILGVQLFKGAFYYCDGPDIKNVHNKSDCLADKRNNWINRKYNFDDLGKALMSLFVLSSRDGWVNIMYTGLDAVGVDQQPEENYSEWRLLYFIAFILLVGFFVLNMFVGVVVENFHRCREEQEKEERVRRAAKRAQQMEKKRRKLHEPPYYANYSKPRLLIHSVVTSKYFDLAIAAVIGLNVVTMALEFYMMPKALTYALKIFNYFFTAVFILESIMKLVALGFHLYLKDKWNQLDIGIVTLSIIGIVLEELESKIIPINPTIIRVMRVLRIARVLKLLKMAKGIRALLDTVMQALPQVGNLGLLFFLLFFIFAALGVELFGRLECTEETPCQGLGEHAHFNNFGMAFLTLFRVATGDNWNGIMKDTLRDDCDDSSNCVKNCCVSTIIAPIFFVIFVLMAQFVLVNVVVAVLMKHLEESHKHMEDELDMEMQLERELAAEQEELLERENAADNKFSLNDEFIDNDVDNLTKFQFQSSPNKFIKNDYYYEKQLSECQEQHTEFSTTGLSKVRSLPSNFIYNPPINRDRLSSIDDGNKKSTKRRNSSHYSSYRQSKINKIKRRQTFHAQQSSPLLPPSFTNQTKSSDNNNKIKRKNSSKSTSSSYNSNLTIPLVTLQKKSSIYKNSNNYITNSDDEMNHKHEKIITTQLNVNKKSNIDIIKNNYFDNANENNNIKEDLSPIIIQDLDVHSVINERRPSKFKLTQLLPSITINSNSNNQLHVIKDTNDDKNNYDETSLININYGNNKIEKVIVNLKVINDVKNEVNIIQVGGRSRSASASSSASGQIGRKKEKNDGVDVFDDYVDGGGGDDADDDNVLSNIEINQDIKLNDNNLIEKKQDELNDNDKSAESSSSSSSSSPSPSQKIKNIIDDK